MDFVAESEDGRVFDVEMQNRKEGKQNGFISKFSKSKA